MLNGTANMNVNSQQSKQDALFAHVNQMSCGLLSITATLSGLMIWISCLKHISHASELSQLSQGCKIPLARSHLRVKLYAGRVKVLTICVVLF